MASWQGERGTRHERGYGYRWTKLRLLILNRDMGLCVPCKNKNPSKITKATQVDHIVPKWKNGGDENTNLQSICDACHADKTAAEAVEASGKAKPAVGVDGWPVEPEQPAVKQMKTGWLSDD